MGRWADLPDEDNTRLAIAAVKSAGPPDTQVSQRPRQSTGVGVDEAGQCGYPASCPTGVLKIPQEWSDLFVKFTGLDLPDNMYGPDPFEFRELPRTLADARSKPSPLLDGRRGDLQHADNGALVVEHAEVRELLAAAAGIEPLHGHSSTSCHEHRRS